MTFHDRTSSNGKASGKYRLWLVIKRFHDHTTYMPLAYLSYIRDTFTILLNTPLAESKSSTLPLAFPMRNMDRRSSLDSVSLLTFQYAT
jgi:hypothetical protein